MCVCVVEEKQFLIAFYKIYFSWLTIVKYLCSKKYKKKKKNSQVLLILIYFLAAQVYIYLIKINNLREWERKKSVCLLVFAAEPSMFFSFFFVV